MKPINRGRRGERGTQLAEFALILPLLLFLVLLVSEAAGFVRVHQVINNAAREGARLAAQKENDPSFYGATAIQNAVQYYAYCNGVDITGTGTNGLGACPGTAPSIVTCSPANISNITVATVPDNVAVSSGVTVPAYPVTVQCGYTMTYMPKLPWFGIASTINLTGSAEFRHMN